MNTATANLENDHVHILRLIDVMEVITQKTEANVEHLETIVWLVRNFADGLHHNKEENLLFPKMVEKGFSFQNGPIAVMMHDHEQGRNYVKGIADNIALYEAGDTGILTEIHKNMQGYIELLRAHISKENTVLFRMADKALSEEEQKKLLDEFERVERNPVCGGVVGDCINQIDTLAKAYNIL
jgi:hemerythrin-like domain-containing protein